MSKESGDVTVEQGTDSQPDDTTEGPIGAEPAGVTTRAYERRTTVIARTVVRIVVPIILLTAIALLLQGHNLPGGGFIGAVLTSTAFVLVATVFGLDHLRSTFLSQQEGDAVGIYRLIFALGLALAVSSGLTPMLVGFPFLTQGVLFIEGVPVYGELEVASALAFDLGIYLAVVGALLTVVGEVGAE